MIGTEKSHIVTDTEVSAQIQRKETEILSYNGRSVTELYGCFHRDCPWMDMYVYMYIQIYVYMYIFMYIYIY